jgi:hypothetical protein
MNDPKNGGQGKNQSAAGSTKPDDLPIPTFGSTQPNPGSTILQEGEDPVLLQSAAATDSTSTPPAGADTSMAAIQKQMDQPKQARHTPVMARRDVEAEATVPQQTLEIPGLSKSLESMMRPDQQVEPVTDLVHFDDHAAQLAFLSEFVKINIHESGDPTAENPVQLGINGRQVFIRRGVDTIVRRMYVEMLLRAKPEGITTQQVRDGDGDVKNLVHKRRALKYPFSIVQDDNPKGRAWMRKIASEA